MERLVRLSATREIVRRHAFLLKKQWGQNFLVDERVLRSILAASELEEGDGAFEIGPGIGTLTQALCEKAGFVLAVEKDTQLQAVLQETLAACRNVKIVWGDVLALDIRQLWTDYFSGRRVRIVANLPYYISTPVLMKILEERLPAESAVFMVQKEVAERLSAKPGGKEYGALSVAAQYYAEVSIVGKVPPGAFFPRPSVDSAVVRLKLRKNPAVSVGNEPFFFEVVRASFSQRRKTIHNNLSHHFSDRWDRVRLKDRLEQAGIDPSRRGETLSIEEFARLSRCLQEELQ
jgi:16S rRNA (adenine1518-N6/adenine1519-N6)-dimethyltransferase